MADSVAEMFARWQAEQDRGIATDLHELCRDCPELLPALLERIGAMPTLLPPTADDPSTVTRDHETTPAAEPANAIDIPGYEVHGELGRGGMSVVYRARQRGLNRSVALKMILGGVHASPAALARFRGEAETIARLRHPNIVQVYDVGEHAGHPFLALEFCDGGSLKDRLAGTPLPPREAAELVRTLADAVHAAHGAGIVHRDLKPGNVLLVKGGVESGESLKSPAVHHSPLTSHQPKIADFDLARKEGSDLTATGAVMGTPSYMAPEQASGRTAEVGAASDVYALGAILYECLTGRPPFQAATPLETMRQVVSDEPAPPRRLNRAVPRDLETICQKCLRKEIADRYVSAAALEDDLRRFLDGQPVSARPVSAPERAWRWMRRNPRAAAALAAIGASLLLGTAASMAFAVRSAGHAAAAKQNENDARASAAEARRLLGEFSVANGVRDLRDGDFLTGLLWFAEPLVRDPDNDAAAEVTRRRLSLHWRYGDRPILLHLFAHDGPVIHAAFSADGRRVVTVSQDGTARVWDARTGTPVTQPLQHDQALFAALNRGGTLVVTVGIDRTARIWDVGGSRPAAAPLKHGQPLAGAAFSRDGTRLATVGGQQGIQVWDWKAGRPLFPPTSQGLAPIWFSRDGRTVISGHGGEWHAWDAATGRHLPTPGRPTASAPDSGFSPDGERFVRRFGDWAEVVETGTARRVALIETPNWLGSVQFGPDGRRVLTAAGRVARVWDAATGRPASPALIHQLDINHAEFSPDGSRILTASADGTARLWSIGALTEVEPFAREVSGMELLADGGSATLTQGGVVNVTRPRSRTVRLGEGLVVLDARFSRDASRVLCVEAGSKMRVWETTSGKPLTPLLPAEDVISLDHADLSPDGRRVVIAAGDHTAGVFDADGGRPITPPLKHRGTIQGVAFRSDGRHVVTASGDGTARIWDAKTGEPRSPPMVHGEGVASATFCPGGRRIVTTTFGTVARVWDAQTGQPVGQPLRHAGHVKSAEFDPDGSRVVTASEDGTARVWDAATGQPLTPAMEHRPITFFALFSPDGRTVMSAGADSQIRLWDAATGLPLSPPISELSVDRNRVRFSPDSRRLLTLRAGNVRLRDIAADGRTPDEWLMLVRLMHGHRLDVAGGLVPLPVEEQRALLAELRAKRPSDFAVGRASAVAWRNRQIAECLTAGDLTAAEFHRDWLIHDIATHPPDTSPSGQQ